MAMGNYIQLPVLSEGSWLDIRVFFSPCGSQLPTISGCVPEGGGGIPTWRRGLSLQCPFALWKLISSFEGHKFGDQCPFNHPIDIH